MVFSKIIIFDLDGVLVNTVEGHYQAWKAVADRMEIAFNMHDNDQLRGVPRAIALKQIAGKNYSLSAEEESELLLLKKNVYLNWVYKQGTSICIPGTQVLLQKLRKQDYQIAIASASKNALLLLEKARLTSLIDFVSDGNFTGAHKPAPDQIQSIMDQFSLSSDDTLVVEDSIAGIQAAKALGIRCIGIGNIKLKSYVDKYFESVGTRKFYDFIIKHFPSKGIKINDKCTIKM